MSDHGGGHAESHASQGGGGVGGILGEAAKVIGVEGHTEGAADLTDKIGMGPDAAMSIVGDLASAFLGPVVGGENPIKGGGGGTHGSGSHGGGGHGH